MRFFNLSGYATAFLTLLLGLSVSKSSLAQVSPTERNNVLRDGSIIHVLSEVTPPNQRLIQGYACYSSPDSERIPTTYVFWTEGDSDPQYIPIIRWTSTTFEDSGFSPRRRCEIISERLDRYFKLGILEYIVQGQLSQQQVLFAASELLASSDDGFSLEPVQPHDDNLIITLEPNEDPEVVLGSFVDALKARRGPITRGVRWIRVNKEIEPGVFTETPLELQGDTLPLPQ